MSKNKKTKKGIWIDSKYLVISQDDLHYIDPEMVYVTVKLTIEETPYSFLVDGGSVTNKGKDHVLRIKLKGENNKGDREFKLVEIVEKKEDIIKAHTIYITGEKLVATYLKQGYKTIERKPLKEKLLTQFKEF